MKVCKFYNESKRRFIRECPNTIVEANYEFVMVVHLLWKLTRKALKAAINVMFGRIKLNKFRLGIFPTLGLGICGKPSTFTDVNKKHSPIKS